MFGVNVRFEKTLFSMSEDGRAVKACDSSSHGAIFVGSSPTPRIEFGSSHPKEPGGEGGPVFARYK